MNTGGAAFPGFQYEIGSGQCKTKYSPEGVAFTEVYDPGMTLRDFFAGQALAAWGAGRNNGMDFIDGSRANHHERIAQACYQYADAMIAASKVEQPTGEVKT